MMTISMQGFASRAAYTVFTFYMMLFLLRWVGVYLQLDLYNPWFRWITRLTDPLLRVVRRYVPNLGPWDISFVVAVLIVFAVREVSINILHNIGL